jgi:hypothetical protein
MDRRAFLQTGPFAAAAGAAMVSAGSAPAAAQAAESNQSGVARDWSH